MVLRYPDAGQLWEMSSTVTAGAGEPAITLTAVAVASRMAAQEARAARAGTELRLAAARLSLGSQLDHFWSRRVTEEALPLLAGVATGLVDPTGPRVVATARGVEASLRDELVLGPDRQPLIATLAGLRAAGWQVTTALGPDDDPAALACAGELARLLGPPATDGQVVTLSTNRGRGLAVVLGAGEGQRRRWRDELVPLGGRVDDDLDFTRLVLPAR